MSSWAPGGWMPSDVDLPFPLLEICPEAPAYMAEAGHFSPRDLRKLIEILDLDSATAPEDVYHALIRRSQDHPWFLGVVEMEIASARVEAGPRSPRNQKSSQKFIKTMNKLPLARLSLAVKTDLHSRLSELLDVEVAPDIAVAAFTEYAICGLMDRHRRDEFDSSRSFALHFLAHETREDQVLALLPNIITIEDPFERARGLVILLEAAEEYTSQEIQDHIVDCLKALTAHADATSSSDVFNLISRLADLAHDCAAHLHWIRDDTILELLTDLGVELDHLDFDDVDRQRLEDWFTHERVKNLEELTKPAPELDARLDEIRSEIAAATQADDFGKLSTLGINAQTLKAEIASRKAAQDALPRIVYALIEDDEAALAGAVRALGPDFSAQAEDGDDSTQEQSTEIETPSAEHSGQEPGPDDAPAPAPDTAPEAVPAVPVSLEPSVVSDPDAGETDPHETGPGETGADNVMTFLSKQPAAPIETQPAPAAPVLPRAPVDPAPGEQSGALPAEADTTPPPDNAEGDDIEDETPSTDPNEASPAPGADDAADQGIGTDAADLPLPEGDQPRDTAPLDPAVLCNLLDRDLIGIAADAAEAFEQAGWGLPIEAIALRTAAASRAPHREYGHDMQRFQAIASRLANETLDELGSAMVIGALIRPAILGTSFGFRQSLPDYCRGIIGTHLQESVDAISTLDYDFPPSADELARLSGSTHVPQKARIARQLADWCEAFSSKTSRWPFATMFMHHIVSETGLIGRASAAISAGHRDAAPLARRALDELRNQQDIEDRSIEFAASAGKHSVQIYPKGLEYLEQKFDEPLGLLDRWLKAVEREGGRGHQSEDRLRTTLSTLRSRLAKAATGLELEATAEPDSLSASVIRWVLLQIAEVRRVLEGGDAGTFATLDDALAAERDLLPAPLREAIEANEVPAKLALEVLSKERVPEPEEAFDRACDEGAFDTATRLAVRFSLDTEAALEQAMRAFAQKWLGEIAQRDRRLRTVAKVDYANQDEIGRQLSWCEMTSERLANVRDGSEVHDLADVPEYLRRLDLDIAAFEVSIREEQLGRIARYRTEQNAEDADALLAEMGDLTIEAAEDRIAQLRDGRSAASFDIDLAGLLPEFTPTFLTFATSAEWPRNTLAFRRAMEGDGPLHVDEDRRGAGVSFIELFREAVPHGERKKPDQVKLRELFEEIGFEETKIHGMEGISRANAWTATLQGKLRSDGTWFLPPIFGSKAQAGYRLVVCAADALPENIVKTLSSDMPSIIVLAGVADIPRRQELAERLRGSALPALVIDEALIAFAATRRETRARTIFECGLPYGRVEPYITDAGQLPPEMFFGRSEEIRKIMSRTADGCLVYGGRQLGKSALLAHVARIHHDPEQDRIVVRREVKSLGNSEPTTAIWGHIASMLGPEIVKPTSQSPSEIARDIRGWTLHRPKSQILCLFDEADHFMDADTRDDYPELSRLKELMEDTERRFKVVFAGLHNVQRISKQPNSPLLHLGSPVCIGPLNRSEDDRRAAYDLVILPMRAAGFRFESQKAVEDILAWANYYPSLVQEYAKGLLATSHGVGSGKSYSLPPDGPLWVIPTSELFTHRGFAAIASRVREKFHYTLDLDPRYALVAYTLARLSVEGEEQKALVTGYRPEELLEEAKHFWPKHSQVPASSSFEPLLDELFDLGVLGRQSPANTRRYRYVLRTREVAAMLGVKDDIYDALSAIEHKDPTVAYDRSIHRRRFAANGNAASQSWNYAPLSDLQIERLLDTQAEPVQIICGLEILDLNRVEPALRKISETGRLPNATGGVSIQTASSTRDLRKLIEKPRQATKTMHLIFYAPQSGDEAARVMAFAENQPNVINRLVRVVLLLDAADNDMRGLANRRQNQSQFLAPWGAEMIRVHLAQSEWSKLDTPALRKAILTTTGGLPGPTLKLIQAMHLSDSPAQTAAEWDTEVTFPEQFQTGLLGRAMTVLMMDDEDDYETFNDLMIEEVHQDLVTIGPDLIATGLVSEWRPKAGRIRSSAFGEFVSSHLKV